MCLLSDIISVTTHQSANSMHPINRHALGFWQMQIHLFCPPASWPGRSKLGIPRIGAWPCSGNSLTHICRTYSPRTLGDSGRCRCCDTAWKQSPLGHSYRLGEDRTNGGSRSSLGKGKTQRMEGGKGQSQSPVPLQPRDENPKKPIRQKSHSLPSTPARHTHCPVTGWHAGEDEPIGLHWHLLKGMHRMIVSGCKTGNSV